MSTEVSCFYLLMGIVATGKKCRQERSINRLALQGFVFKTFLVTVIHECDTVNVSYSYVIGEKSCELNNRTKEARPENFLRDPSRFYHKRLVDRGM